MEFLIPLVASAQATDPTVKQLVWKISYNIINPLIVLGFAVALVVFLWGVIEYIYDRNAGAINESLKGDAIMSADGSKKSDRIVWGLFGLFIMASAFGIMRLLKDILGSTIPTP